MPRLSSINIYFPCCNELYFSTARSQILRPADRKAKKVCCVEGKREKGGEKKSTTWQFSETSTTPLTHPNFADMVGIIHFPSVKGRGAAVRGAVSGFVRARGRLRGGRRQRTRW